MYEERSWLGFGAISHPGHRDWGHEWGEAQLDSEGKIDYQSLKPVLFEFPTYQYLRTGEVIGKCLSFNQ